ASERRLVLAAFRRGAGRRYVVLDTGSSDGERYSPSAVRKLLALAAIVVMTACGSRAMPAQTPQWQTIGELSQPRAYASAIGLSSGKILVVGGFDRFAPDVMNVQSELIDPAAGKVTLLPQRLLGRVHQSITAAWEDLVIVAGGVEWLDTYWSPVDRVDVFRPSQRGWVLGAPLRHPRSDHAATALQDGLGSGRSVVHRFGASRFVASGSRVTPRFVAQAAALPDGRVVLSGGLPLRMHDFAPLRSVEIWDPETGLWSELPPAPTPRAWG